MGTQGSPVKSYDYLLKFLLVGDSDVGKGEILESLQDGASESPYAYSNGKGEAPRGDGAAGAAGGPWRGGGARCGGGARRGRSVPSPRLCPIRRPLRSHRRRASSRAARKRLCNKRTGAVFPARGCRARCVRAASFVRLLPTSRCVMEPTAAY